MRYMFCSSFVRLICMSDSCATRKSEKKRKRQTNEMTFRLANGIIFNAIKTDFCLIVKLCIHINTTYTHIHTSYSHLFVL